MNSIKSKHQQCGGAAIEYIIVSIFATITAVAGVGFVAKLAKEKINAMTEQIDQDGSLEQPDFLDF